MERTEKNLKSAIGALHSFPTLHPTSKDGDRADACFRPMFQASLGGFNHAKNTPGDDAEGDNTLAVALKESYERGLAKGNADACGLVQQELAPTLQSFFSRLNAFSGNFKQFTRHQATQMVTLALSIAGKISGGQPLRNADDLQPVQEALDAGLQRWHQLNLQLNGDDLEVLADLMRCQNMEMIESDAVRISKIDGIQRGVPQISHPSATLEAIREQMAQTIEDLP
jgi:flagellar biosynthesis/type III secretory pathway protein FliH